jgi:FkbM family methyltransferase
MDIAKTRTKLVRALTPTLTAQTPHGPIRVRCATSKSVIEARERYRLEPETLAWIDQLPKGDRLWDIGANIGLIAMYAAKAGLVVAAFEPGAANYAAMNEGLWLNGLGDKVSAYCLALTETTGVGAFHMGDPRAGAALHAFGEPESHAGRFQPKFSQAMLGLSVDDAVSLMGITPPDHIKLDVDSIEDKILRGARATLPRVKSVLIEIESTRPPEWRAAVHSVMQAAGFTVRNPDQRNVEFVRL